MKQQRYCLLIGFAALFTFIACVQTPPSSAAVSETSSIVNSVVNSAETTINLKEKYDENLLIQIISTETKNDIVSIIGVFEYLSPDGKNTFIEIHTDESYLEADDDYNETEQMWDGTYDYVFLNDFDNLYYKYDSYGEEAVGAVWIDDDTAAIAAEFIVDLKTGEKKTWGHL